MQVLRYADLTAIAPEKAACSLDKKPHIRYDDTVHEHGIIP